MANRPISWQFCKNNYICTHNFNIALLNFLLGLIFNVFLNVGHGFSKFWWNWFTILNLFEIFQIYTSGLQNCVMHSKIFRCSREKNFWNGFETNWIVIAGKTVAETSDRYHHDQSEFSEKIKCFSAANLDFLEFFQGMEWKLRGIFLTSILT